MPPLNVDDKIRSGTRGGFGVYLYKILADECSYARDGDENVLKIRKRIPL
jgi:hypothetical protein